ncbi:MAG TPA: DUF4256 domain-containing protein [Anaerolineales bacterium]|nr:DUF4256 domain-containing protein [Anaerolineales bacterium]
MNEQTTHALTPDKVEALLTTLRTRFEQQMHRHAGITWQVVQIKLQTQPQKLWTLYEMEGTGGEPDVVGQDAGTAEILFFDCAVESPKGRRSLCYDRAALDARKEHKPENSAMDLVNEWGAELLDEEQYRTLQNLGRFDSKTSSWLKTPSRIRALGGAIFGDCRYEHVFVYHNGAESYYAARGFRCCLRV